MRVAEFTVSNSAPRAAQLLSSMLIQQDSIKYGLGAGKFRGRGFVDVLRLVGYSKLTRHARGIRDNNDSLHEIYWPITVNANMIGCMIFG